MGRIHRVSVWSEFADWHLLFEIRYLLFAIRPLWWFSGLQLLDDVRNVTNKMYRPFRAQGCVDVYTRGCTAG